VYSWSNTNSGNPLAINTAQNANLDRFGKTLAIKRQKSIIWPVIKISLLRVQRPLILLYQ
jgi:hypothetical protein